MKRALLVVGVLGITASAVFGVSSFFFAQRADYGWHPSVVRATFTSEHPRILFDEGHHNASTAGLSGRYWPFARLLRADGYIVDRGQGAVTRDSLRGVRILVIANASGAPKPQLFGINLPIPTNGRRGDPAFTETEVGVVRDWIEGGGSMLLLADHAPFGEAVFTLASALGVTMHKGFVEVPGETSDPLLFSAEDGRLGTHPIITGDRPGTSVSRVMTYTGQSLDAPPPRRCRLARAAGHGR